MILALLLGCVTPQSFPEQYSRAVCDRYEECVKAAFDATYDDIGECVDDLSSLFDSDLTEDCEFDAGAANDCLNSTRSLSCDELFTEGVSPDGCADVYSDC